VKLQTGGKPGGSGHRFWKGLRYCWRTSSDSDATDLCFTDLRNFQRGQKLDVGVKTWRGQFWGVFFGGLRALGSF
jgi:hypothetical protein